MPCRRFWQGFAIMVIKRNNVIDDMTELLEYRHFIITVASAKHKPGTASYVALVLF